VTCIHHTPWPPVHPLQSPCYSSISTLSQPLCCPSAHTPHPTGPWLKPCRLRLCSALPRLSLGSLSLNPPSARPRALSGLPWALAISTSANHHRVSTGALHTRHTLDSTSALPRFPLSSASGASCLCHLSLSPLAIDRVVTRAVHTIEQSGPVSCGGALPGRKADDIQAAV